MNKKIAARWVNALRSGDFTQTIEYLQDDGGYCCLGVLCELAVKSGAIPKPNEPNEDFLKGQIRRYGVGESIEDQVLPRQVMLWAGISSSGGKFENSEGAFDLTELNDNGNSFEEIADIIEANWGAL